MIADWVKLLVITPAVLGNIVLGVIVLVRNPKSLVNRTFFFIAFLFGIWALCLLFYEFGFVESRLFWIYSTYISASVLMTVVLLFSFIFPKPQYHKARIWAVIYSISFLLFTVWLLFFTKSWVIDVVVESQRGVQTILGFGYVVWTAAIWGVLAWAVVNLILSMRHASGFNKIQLRYLMVGFALYGVVTTAADVIVPLLWHDTRLFSLSAGGSLFFTFGTAYVIIRHRFMDLRFAFQQVFVYSIQVALMTLVLAGGAYFYWYISGNAPRPSVLILLVVLSTVLALIVGKVQSASRYLARRFFFQSIYDYQQTLRDLSLNLSAYLEMPKLVEIIVNTLIQTMRLNRVAVLVRDYNNNHYKIQKTLGFNEENGISLVRDNFLTNYIEKSQHLVVLEEIDRLIEESPSSLSKEQLRQLKEHMIYIEASLLLPIINHGEVISLIVLGDKLSGDPYSIQDIDLLKTIASQASVALENARLYREVSLLNTSLQQRVEEATTELQKKNFDLSKALEDLKSLDKMKDQLIAIASHELRTPASNVQNYLWMLITKPDPQSAFDIKDRDKLSKAYVGIQNLIKLINDILDVSKIEGGKLEVDFKPVNYEKIIHDVLEELSLKAKTKGLSLARSDSSQYLAPSVLADPLRFKEVVTNLVVNAIKYTEHGGVVIDVTRHGTEIVFSVKDTGRGIAPEHLQNVFDKFYREDTSLSASNTETGGTGLGLYIAKSIIELMKGKIWVESTLGHGSTFYVSLPASELAEESATFPDKKAFKGIFTREDYLKHKNIAHPQSNESVVINPFPKLSRQRVLLIEDETEMRNFYADFLSEKYQVETAKDGEEGLAKLRLNKFDLVLLDVMMPRLDGVGFLEKKKKELEVSDVPVILLTNLGEEETLEKCFELGAKSMIMKSDVTPDQLLQVVEKALSENPSFKNYNGPALVA